MNLDFQLLEDKVEFFEATSLKSLQQKINEQIEHNRAILLNVHSVSHQMHLTEEGRTYYSAVVHFKLKKG
ncbi:MAG: YrzA family protein [Bacillaceae bacterium]|nr:YrzA family protein [Bacillaceae bacterium]